MVFTATLRPVADVSYLEGSGELQNPCHGVFTFRLTTANLQQGVFLTFIERSVLFSSFTATLPWERVTHTATFKGVGLK